MARTFRQRRQMHAVAELNVTNLVDLAFTLLIIFMIATPLIQQKEQTIPVDLPVESKRPQVKPDPDDKFVSIIIQADGSFNLSGRAISLAELKTEFARSSRETKPPVFNIRMDAKATAQQFLVVMDELKNANLTRISIDTKTKD